MTNTRGLSATNARQELGRKGEDLAAAHYELHGGVIVDRNWRSGRAGELDLIVATPGNVIFCEVKTRRSTTWGHPSEAVGRDKQQRIRRLAAAWLQQQQEAGVRVEGHVRFDVASVVDGRVEIIEAAF